MKSVKAVQPLPDIESLIQTIRGQKIILDADLALIYSVPTKVLNQAIKRNRARFPHDFMFQPTREEWLALQVELIELTEVKGIRSQIVTGSSKHRDPRFLPFAFTEQGAIMAATVLNCPSAVRMSVYVVRAFVKMREMLGGTRELARKLAVLEAELKSGLDVHESAIVDILQRIMKILDPPPPPAPLRRQIGFHVNPESETGSGSRRNESSKKNVECGVG